MYTLTLLLGASCMMFCSAAFSSELDYDDFQKTDEEAPTRYVAGIPYGSVSGRVAEYFATLRTPFKADQIRRTEDDSNLEEQKNIEHGFNFR